MKKDKYISVPEFLDYEVYPIVNLVQLLQKYQPQDQQIAVRLTCPRCKRQTAIIEKGQSFMLCPKEVGCGFRRTIVELVAHPKKPLGDIYRNVVKKMTSMTGKSIPEYLHGQPGAPYRAKKPKEKKKPPTFESYEEYLSRVGKARAY